MDEILDKLKILNYGKDFCKIVNLQPMNRTYFLLPHTNPNEQFYYFTSLAAWILHLCGSRFEMPGQFDDPNATTANIVSELKKVGIQSEFGPGKLKLGYGDAVIFVLESLTNKALDHCKFKFQKPVHKGDTYADEAEVDAEAEVTADKPVESIEVEDDMEAQNDDDELFIENMPVQDNKKEEIKPKPQLIISNTSAQEWKLELERVTPLLKVSLPSSMKDWRVHVEQMKFHQDSISGSMTETRKGLTKLGADVEKTLEKVQSREKYLNQQFEGQTEQYRSLLDNYSALKQRYNESSGIITDLTNELSRISDELENSKGKMDDVGSGMTDSKPLVTIKQSVLKLKSELKQMDLRVGVIQHTLLYAKMKTKGQPLSTNPVFHGLNMSQRS